VHIDVIKYIGKESNSLEEVDAGLIHTEQGVYTEYPDPARDEWESVILPALQKLPLPILVKESCLTERALQKIRAGRRPNRKNQKLLMDIVRKLDQPKED
jgi:hypothetical protein